MVGIVRESADANLLEEGDVRLRRKGGLRLERGLGRNRRLGDENVGGRAAPAPSVAQVESKADDD